MNITIDKHVHYSFADVIELAIPKFDDETKDILGTTSGRINFEARGLDWQVKVKVGTRVSVYCFFVYHHTNNAQQQPPEGNIKKDRRCGEDCPEFMHCFTRLGNETTSDLTDPRGEHKLVFPLPPKENKPTKLREVSHSAMVDSNRAFLDPKTKSLHIRILIREKVWYPVAPPGNPVLKAMRNKQDYADAAFLVGKATIRVHKCVLQIVAPVLWEMVREATEPVALPDVHEDDFDRIMNWIYCNELDDDFDCLEDAKDVLTAASKFDLKEMKMNAESVIVDKYLKVSNAAELMVWGHSHCCALLQEAAMELHILFPKAVMQSGWKLVLESPALVEDLLEMSATVHPGMECSGIERTSVTALRKYLLDLCLERSMDGSRAMMIKVLVEHGITIVE